MVEQRDLSGVYYPPSSQALTISPIGPAAVNTQSIITGLSTRQVSDTGNITATFNVPAGKWWKWSTIRIRINALVTVSEAYVKVAKDTGGGEVLTYYINGLGTEYQLNDGTDRTILEFTNPIDTILTENFFVQASVDHSGAAATSDIVFFYQEFDKP